MLLPESESEKPVTLASFQTTSTNQKLSFITNSLSLSIIISSNPLHCSNHQKFYLCIPGFGHVFFFFLSFGGFFAVVEKICWCVFLCCFLYTLALTAGQGFIVCTLTILIVYACFFLFLMYEASGSKALAYPTVVPGQIPLVVSARSFIFHSPPRKKKTERKTKTKFKSPLFVCSGIWLELSILEKKVCMLPGRLWHPHQHNLGFRFLMHIYSLTFEQSDLLPVQKSWTIG